MYIKGADFLKNLTPIEKKLLQPFISHGSIISYYKTPFVVNVKIIKKTNTVKNKLFDPSLVNKIKAHLSCPSHHNIRKKLELYLKIIFNSDENQFRYFANILIAMGNNIKVMPFTDSLAIFNGDSRSSYIFLHKRCTQNMMSTRNLDILKLLFLMIVTEENGALLHASSVDEKGFGYTFVGPSNSGKSTIVRMAGFKRILSDDTTVIRRINHSYAIFSNPWWNADTDIDITYSQNSVPLKAIFFIKKARKTSMRKMDIKEILARLMYNEEPFRQFSFYNNRGGIKNCYVFFWALFKNIPVFELQIKKDLTFKQEFYSLLYRYVT